MTTKTCNCDAPVTAMVPCTHGTWQCLCCNGHFANPKSHDHKQEPTQ